MNYVIKPNIPDKRINKVIMQKIPGSGLLPFDVISVPACNSLPTPEQLHADMQIIHIKNNVFVCEKSVADYYKLLLPEAIIIKGEAVSNKYPDNIAFNASVIGNKIFCNIKYTDPVLIRIAKDMDFELINVKQGYTKCSTAIVNEKAVITSDIGLAKIYKDNGLDVLLITEGNIVLKGYNYGFIGGCCGKISEKILWFYGNVSEHPDYKRILEFCRSYQCEIEYIANIPLTDIGSVLPVSY